MHVLSACEASTCCRAGGRDAQGLLPLLTHLVKHITDPRHADLFLGVANRLLDIYAPAVRLPACVLLLLPGMHAAWTCCERELAEDCVVGTCL